MTTLNFDQAAIQQAIIDCATQRLTQDASFLEQCSKHIANLAWTEGAEFKSDFRLEARQKKDAHLERLEQDIKKERTAQTERARHELLSKCNRAIRSYVTTKLSNNEIRDIALKAVDDIVRRAFGRRAAQIAKEVLSGSDLLEQNEGVDEAVRRTFGRRAQKIANEVLSGTDRLELLLAEELEQKEVA